MSTSPPVAPLVEASGPRPAAPDSHPAIAEVKDGSIVINTKTIVMAVAFLFGGGVSGTGVQLFGEPKAPPALVQKIDDLTQANKELEQKIELMAVTLADVKAELAIARAERKRNSLDIEKLR